LTQGIPLTGNRSGTGSDPYKQVPHMSFALSAAESHTTTRELLQNNAIHAEFMTNHESKFSNLKVSNNPATFLRAFA
jgi:hypothetical protein